MRNKKDLSAEASEIVKAAYCTLSLLQRFADMYGDVPLSGEMSDIGMKLWRDYYEFMGIHVIRTDEGWESGEAKEHYVQLCKKEGTRVEDCILDEVNAP